VIATDASREQLARAARHPRIGYVIAEAEASPVRSGSADLVTVAQALHWLDLPAFWQEARRALAPGGVVAVWCYALARIGPGIDEVLRTFYEGTVGPYWSPRRALVDAEYRTIDFPFREIAMPSFRIEADLTLDQLLGYVGTWSAVLACRADRGTDPMQELRAGLGALWGDGQALRRVTWPIGLRAGRA
jgi:SAM-dependent methyltransferase